MTEARRPKGTLTIYDVARLAGVSIASVSRVLNGQGTPRPETRERVMRAVGELSFVPDGAARALSNGLKEVVGVVFRRGERRHLRTRTRASSSSTSSTAVSRWRRNAAATTC